MAWFREKVLNRRSMLLNHGIASVCPFLLSYLQMVTNSERRHHPDFHGVLGLLWSYCTGLFFKPISSPCFCRCVPALFIFLPLCTLNSDLHTKSCFVFVKLNTPKQQNEAIYFHIPVSPNVLYMRKKKAPLQLRKKENNFHPHWTRTCCFVWIDNFRLLS